MFEKKIDVYKYSQKYCKLLNTHKIVFEKYQKSRINIHEQTTKDCDIEFDALREIELLLKNFRIQEIESSFNIKSIGLLILRKINSLKKEYDILHTNMSEDLSFSFIINNKKVNLEYKSNKIQLRTNDKLLYYFDCISLNEYFTSTIKEIIPKIKFIDLYHHSSFMNKVIKYLVPKLNICKENLTSVINIKAYDILDNEESIKKSIVNKLPVILDFSYLIDNRPASYIQISETERENIKNKWIDLFFNIDWSVHQFLQLNNIYNYMNNLDEIFYNQPQNYAKFYHYNMFFLMILIRSYNSQKNHTVANIFGKFLLSFYSSKKMIEVNSKYYEIDINDRFELNDDFFELIDQINFFPDANTVKFLTENQVDELKESYKNFTKEIEFEKISRKKIDFILN